MWYRAVLFYVVVMNLVGCNGLSPKIPKAVDIDVNVTVGECKANVSKISSISESKKTENLPGVIIGTAIKELLGIGLDSMSSTLAQWRGNEEGLLIHETPIRRNIDKNYIRTHLRKI